MNSYLKLIGSASKPITGEPYNGIYDDNTIGFRKKQRPGVQCGDLLFLYASGGTKRIFALAQAISDPKQNPEYNSAEEGSCRWVIHVQYSINLPVTSGILIDELSARERNLTLSLRRQSHIKLSEEEAQSAYIKLLEKDKTLNPGKYSN